MKAKKILSAMLVVGMVMGLAACGSSDNASSDPVSAGTEANGGAAAAANTGEEPEGIVEGTTLTVAWDSDKQTHLPWSNSSNSTIYMMMYDTLFQSVDGEISGLIADTWEVSEDGMQYVIQIHDDIYFCNKDGSKGNQMTAESVVKSLEYTKEGYAQYFTNIESIEATGDYEITVTFSAPYADFMIQFANSCTGIVDPALVEQYGSDSNDAAVGSGPYYMESYEADSQFVFKANPYYWDADRMPHIETVTAKIISDDSTALTAIQTGEVDWIESGSYMNVQNLTADGSLTAYQKVGAFNPLYFNCNVEPFDDPNVRQAIGLLIDSEELLEVAFDGQGQVINGAFGTDTITYQDYDFANVYDPEKGLQLLEEAGVDPESLVLESYASGLNAEYMPALQAQLAKYGITLNFEMYDVGTFIQTVSTGNWDVICWFGLVSDIDPYAAYNNMYSEDGIYRTLFIDETDPELHQQVQELLAEANQCLTIEEQVPVLQQIDDLLAEKYVWSTNVSSSEWIVYNSKLAGMHLSDFLYMCEVWELYWTE